METKCMQAINSGRKSVTRWMVAWILMLATGSSWGAEQELLPNRPLSNPVYTDIAMPKREVNLIYIHQRLPSHIDTTAGKLRLDGHAEVMAIQLEIPFSECLSLVANKTGYVRFEPQDTLTAQDGMGDISAGLKWLVQADEDSALALRGTFEFPLGSDQVFQGNGNGNFSPAVLSTWWSEKWTANGVAGLIIPMESDEESLVSYVSVGGEAKVSKRCSLLAELNWFHILSDGEADADFGADQLNMTVPAIAEFEGGDYFNLGSAKGDHNPDFATAVIGARFQATDGCSLGMAYEYPLTQDSASLTDDRFTVNLQLRF